MMRDVLNKQGFEFLSREVIKAANTQGYADTFILESVDENGRQISIKSREYYFVSANNFIAIVCSASAELFDRYVQQVDELVSSFAFTQP